MYVGSLEASIKTLLIFSSFCFEIFDESDFRKKIKNRDGNVIHVNLNTIKPKGNG